MIASTMMTPKIPIIDAREFHTSAFRVKPQNETGSFGSSLGVATPCGSLAALIDEKNRVDDLPTLGIPCSLVMDESRRPEEHNPVTTTAWGDIVVEAMTITSEFLQKFLTAEGFQAIRREKQNTVASICEELNSIHDGNHTFF